MHHVVGNGMRLDTTSEVRMDDRWTQVLSDRERQIFEAEAGVWLLTVTYSEDGRWHWSAETGDSSAYWNGDAATAKDAARDAIVAVRQDWDETRARLDELERAL